MMAGLPASAHLFCSFLRVYSLSNRANGPERHESLRDATTFNQDLRTWIVPAEMNCTEFASDATDWLAAYGGSIASKTPPLSASMIAVGCGA